MPLILAIEPDKRQSSQLAGLVKGLHAELVHRPNAADGLDALHGRVPDLVLTSSLISPRDDAALATHLRELGAAAAHVQTVTIPLLGSAPPATRAKGMLAALRREKPQVMTDGCAPDVFAEQVRQYLATAEEQKVAAATRVVLEPAPVPEMVAAEFEGAPEFEAASEIEPEPEIAPEPEPEIVIEAAEAPLAVEAIEAAPAAEPAAEALELAAIEPEELAADEPTGLPLSQLLQLVTETAVIEAPIVEAPIVEMAAPIVAEVVPVVEPELAVEPEAIAEPEPVLETEPVLEATGQFADMFVDPVAAQALDELASHAAPPSLADGIPAEVPVPVVEMHSFQSLDSIASELAAGPSRRRESLDDLASLFAATPSPAPAAAAAAPEVAHVFTAPMHGEKSLFASLFAEPAPARPSAPVEVPPIDSSLFASAPAPAPAAPSAFEIERFETAPEPEPEPVVFETAAVEPVVEAAPEPIEEAVVEEAIDDEPAVAFEPVVFEPVHEEPAAVAAAPAFEEEEIALDVDAFVAPPAPVEPSPFAFTLVDGFGDAWSDFEVQSISAVATDLGVGEHAPTDPYAAQSRPAARAPQVDLSTAPGAPALDEEALSIIGDAARKASLDAFVVEEFERGMSERRAKKLKKKVHAGAAHVPPAPERAAAKPTKRPVQDEWGMFDPEQCGFAALEDEEGAETRPTTGTRVRVISY